MLNNSDMAFGAVAAIILDYAAVAFVIGLLVLDRWLGVRRGITLDTLFGLIVALGMAVWFAGTRFKRRLLRHRAATQLTQIGGSRSKARFSKPENRFRRWTVR